MAFEELRLTPGIDIEKTPSLNAAGISDAAFIRWKEGQVEKLGGWSRFYPFSIGSTPRALHAWEDLSLRNWLAIGCTTALDVLTSGALSNITPELTVNNSPPDFSTVSGSPTITVIDLNISNPSINDFIFISQRVGVGGLILSGIYKIQTILSSTSYTITAASNATGTRTSSAITAASWAATGGGQVTFTTAGATGIAVGEEFTVLGMTPAGYNAIYIAITGTAGTTLIASQPVNPGAATVNGKAYPAYVSTFGTTAGSTNITVFFENHGLSVGSIVNFLIPTIAGGITIVGSYTVTAVADANTYTIVSSTLAAVTTGGGAENNAFVNLVYYIAIGPQIPFSGWGVGTWGSGGWGTGTPSPQGAGTPITATDWSLLNFGEDLIANPAGQNGAVLGGPLYDWNPRSGFLNAQIIPTGPITADGCFLTQPTQIIIAWGASFNGAPAPLRLLWCDAGNFLQWTPTSTNFAGGFTISRGSKIVACVQGGNQFTVHTDIGVWSGQYIGQPLVFSIIEVMTGCGLVGRKALGVAGTTEFWMSQNQFFQMAAGGVPAAMPCTVWDKVFQRIDRTNLDKVRFFANSQFTEIGWYFPSIGGSGENDTYVKVNNEGIWDYGPMGRSAWIDQSILGPPIGTTSGGLIYQHETSPDADGVALVPFIRTGDYALGKGEEFGVVDYVIPDAKYGLDGAPQTAQMLYTLFFKDFPNDTPRAQGPYTVSQLTQFFEPNMRGRLMSMRIESQDLGSFWRLGLVRSRINPAGRNPL